MEYRELFQQTYRNKRIFLTGHTGFKGSWLLTWFSLLGANVKGYSLEPEHTNDLYNLIKGNQLCDSVIDDIRNKAGVEKAITDFQPDFIFHLAAQPLVRRSYEVPVYTYEVNVNGTAHVLEGLRKLKKPCTAVIITTDKVYENKEIDYAYTEADQLGGYDPYSSSKAAAEILVSSYRNSFFFSTDEFPKGIATARAGNVIGGGDQSADRIIPDIIRALEKNDVISVRNPRSIRPWQHVLEPLAGYLLLGAKMNENPLSFSGAWNFGPYEEDVLNVEELVQHALHIYGKGEYKPANLPNQPHEASLLKLSIQKALHELQWKPLWNAKRAIAETIEWYKRANKMDALELTQQQINSYQT